MAIVKVRFILNAALTVCLSKIQEIPIFSFIPHPANVVAVSLTSLRTDAGNTARAIIQYITSNIFLRI